MEGPHVKQKIEKLESDIDDLLFKLQAVWSYVNGLGDEDIISDVEKLLGLGQADNPNKDTEHVSILEIALAKAEAEVEKRDLVEWAEDAEATFNAITEETDNGLRMLARREAQVGPDS